MNFFTKWHPFINRVISMKFDGTREESLANLYDSIIQQPDDGE